MKIERKWCMPDRNTFSIKPINNFIRESLSNKGNGTTIDPFVGNSCLRYFFEKYITNDLNPDMKAEYHLDALEFLKGFNKNSADCVLFDPPYSNRQISECYAGVGLDTKGGELTRSSFYSNLKNEVARITKPGGKVFCCGWNSQGIGKTRGFELKKVLLVAHGGAHNDTIVTFEEKVSP